MQNYITHHPTIQKTASVMNELREQSDFIAHLDTFQNTHVAFTITFKDRLDKINELQQHTIRQ